MAVLLANNATGKLAGSIDASQTSVSLQAGEGSRFPSPTGNDWFPITFVKPDGALEIMRCTSRSNDILTVERAQEGTSAKTFSAGDRCALRVTAAAFEDLRAPKGLIAKFEGSIPEIPTGWALCDGTNGTIDLTDRFVVGAGGAYAVGDTGGADSVTLTTAQIPAHNHTTNGAGGHSHTASTGDAGYHGHSASTGTAGNHRHSWQQSTQDSSSFNLYSFSENAPISGNANGQEVARDGGLLNDGGNHSHSVSIDGNGTHSHSVSVSTVSDHTHTVNNTGGGGSHENRPPYYALAFIQKL